MLNFRGCSKACPVLDTGCSDAKRNPDFIGTDGYFSTALELFHFHAEFVNRLRRRNRIITGITGKAETIFVQAGRPYHSIYGKVVNGIQTDEIGNGFFVFFFRRKELTFG